VQEEHGLFGSLAPVGSVQITAVTVDATTLTLTWSGGTPPYVIQEKSSLTDPQWTDLTTTSATKATVPRTGAAGFFRISDAVVGAIAR
jgi:hypothetical protein